jgi:hypothetical protein
MCAMVPRRQKPPQKVIGTDAQPLALLGRDGGERRYLLGHALAAAVRADYAGLFEISDVKNLGELFVAILTEKNVLRLGRFLLDRSSLST